MTKKIAIYGGSFNPPRVAHRLIVEMVAREFDEIIVIPCGPRPDKPTVNDIDPVHRATMVDMAFSGLPNVRVELFDLEMGTFTRTHNLDAMFRGGGEIWHIVGADLIKGGNEGRSFIQREWELGEEIWRELNFAVVYRQGIEMADRELPPRSRVFYEAFTGSSSETREKVFRRESVEGLVDRKINDYILRHGLYRGARISGRSQLVLSEVRPKVLFDGRNPKAEEFVRVSGLRDSSHPNLITVIGGDGFMLHAIRNHWRERLPFFGINKGTHGFLMNDPESPAVRELLSGSLSVDLDQMPLLYVEITDAGGMTKRALAFNDVWVERGTGQTAWIELEIDGVRRIPLLVADGILAATPAGSTAYAKAMGALAVPVHAPVLTLVGSNVARPNWKATQITLDSTVTWRTLDPVKRPLNGFVDGADQGPVIEMKIRRSRIAAAELATPPDRAEKIMSSQFPG